MRLAPEGSISTGAGMHPWVKTAAWGVAVSMLNGVGKFPDKGFCGGSDGKAVANSAESVLPYSTCFGSPEQLLKATITTSSVRMARTAAAPHPAIPPCPDWLDICA